MTDVLCVGLVCVDIIQVCESYPKEDTDQRCLRSYWQRGGNASNNCTVLAQLGSSCHFFGTVTDNTFWKFVKDDFNQCNINIENCIMHNGFEFPLSSVILNSKNGSRTIVHSNKNWPEVRFEDFKGLNLEEYKWIQFEGRNVQEVHKMMSYLEEYNKNKSCPIRVSVELEKPNKNLFSLTKLADIIFIGKDFALFNGWKNMDDSISSMKNHVKPGAIVICTWGEKGAVVLDGQHIIRCPAYTPDVLVDSLGAGDTFCAAMIHFLSEGLQLDFALDLSCRLAGAKVGIQGYNGLAKIYSNIVSDANKEI